jgi:hypothetical protein
MNIDDELNRLFTDDRLDLPIRAGAEASVVAGARRLRRRRTAVTATVGAATVVALFAVAASLPGLGGSAPDPAAGPEVAAETTLSTVPSPPSISTGAGTGTVPTSEPAAPNGEPRSGRGTTRRNPPASGGSSSPTPKAPPALIIGPVGYLGLRLGMNAETAEATGLLVAEQPPAQGCQGYDYRTQPTGPDQHAVLISASYGIASITGRPDAVTPDGITAGATGADVKRVYPAAVQASGQWYVSAAANPPSQYVFIMKNQAVAEIHLELKTHDC